MRLSHEPTLHSFGATSLTADHPVTFWRHVECVTGKVAQNVVNKTGGIEQAEVPETQRSLSLGAYRVTSHEAAGV